MKIFWSFTRQAFHSLAVYRFDFWLRFLAAFLMMYGVHWLWKILYTQRPGAFDVDLSQMVTYGVLGMALESIFHPGLGPQVYMAQQVRTGAIDTDLIKPIDFHLYMLARNMGSTLLRLTTLSLPSMAIAYFLLGLQFPVSFSNGLLFGISLIFGYLVLFSLNFLLGLIAIAVFDIRHINWVYNNLVRFLAGQVLPLWLFPDSVRFLVEALPFKSIYYIPLSIYIGKFAGVTALKAIGFQVIWSVVLILIGRTAWGRVHSRLVVQGG